MSRPINPKNRVATRRSDAQADSKSFKARTTEIAAAVPAQVLSPQPIEPSPLFEGPVASPIPATVLAGLQLKPRERRRLMKLHAPISLTASDQLRIDMGDLPAVGFPQHKHTILRMVQDGRFPEPDGYSGGKLRKRPWWKLETLRRFSAGERGNLP